MKATMLLADSAQAIQGKLYILGGGWSIRTAEPYPFAIALKIEVPWDLANRPHRLRLELVDDDGQPVMVPLGDAGVEGAIQIGGDFEVGRPPGLMAGTPLDVCVAIPIPPFPLAANARFVWRLFIDDETREEWQVAFATRAGEIQQPR